MSGELLMGPDEFEAERVIHEEACRPVTIRGGVHDGEEGSIGN